MTWKKEIERERERPPYDVHGLWPPKLFENSSSSGLALPQGSSQSLHQPSLQPFPAMAKKLGPEGNARWQCLASTIQLVLLCETFSVDSRMVQAIRISLLKTPSCKQPPPRPDPGSLQGFSATEARTWYSLGFVLPLDQNLKACKLLDGNKKPESSDSCCNMATQMQAHALRKPELSDSAAAFSIHFTCTVISQFFRITLG